MHYMYGSGRYGCLYDEGPHVAGSISDAVESLAFTFNLGRVHKARLERDLYLPLPLSLNAGADYCEITPCACDEGTSPKHAAELEENHDS